jgi:hypothetical protein
MEAGVDTMATPRTCTDTNCVCPLPNGFSKGGNRICLRHGPATWKVDSTGKSVSVKNTKPAQLPSPEFCPSCCGHIGKDGVHDCPVLALQKEMLAFMAGELCEKCGKNMTDEDDDADEEENLCRGCAAKAK